MSVAVHATLQTVSEVRAALAAGQSLFLAGSREALRQLPRGGWAGGTIHYFMTEEGGLMSEDRLFVTRVPDCALGVQIASYGAGELSQLYRDAPENGFTFVVMPAGSEVLAAFAEQAPGLDGFLLRPMVGWVSGVRADRIGVDAAATFDGRTESVYENRCLALHVTLPANKRADLDIVNIFESGDGDLIHFESAGTHVTHCLIDGKPENFADYIAAHAVPADFPLVGDYNGTPINVSIQKVDPAHHAVELYAPVFPGVDYRFARPIANYEQAFSRAIRAEDGEPAFACNCILNYLYGNLEGKKTGHITGPITFGEIAHQLLNQTMVRLYVRDIG